MKAELIDVFGNDLMVVNTARVSMGKAHREFNLVDDTRLIRYLARADHWSPFAHPKAMFRVELPIFVARQWEKHRIGAVRGYDTYDQNEISRRYVDDAPEFFQPRSWRARPEGSIKQGSGFDLDNQWECENVLLYAHRHALGAYRHLLDLGVAPEQARMVLPQTLYTQWIETGSLAYWARLCALRLDKHAQQEIRDLAEQVAYQMAKAFPVSWAALMAVAHDPQ